MTTTVGSLVDVGRTWLGLCHNCPRTCLCLGLAWLTCCVDGIRFGNCGGFEACWAIRFGPATDAHSGGSPSTHGRVPGVLFRGCGRHGTGAWRMCRLGAWISGPGEEEGRVFTDGEMGTGLSSFWDLRSMILGWVFHEGEADAGAGRGLYNSKRLLCHSLRCLLSLRESSSL